jgi:hypothetical protein
MPGGGSGSSGENEDRPVLSLPSVAPIVNTTLSPTLSPQSSKPAIDARPHSSHHEEEKDDKSLAIIVLVPVLVGAEIVILAGLFLYYRRWKHQRKVYAETVSTDRATACTSWDEESELFI